MKFDASALHSEGYFFDVKPKTGWLDGKIAPMWRLTHHNRDAADETETLQKAKVTHYKLKVTVLARFTHSNNLTIPD